MAEPDGRTGRSFPRLIAELRRRKVLRVAGAYLLAAWFVLQVGDVVVEPLRLPGWTMTLLIVLVALGFPVTVALAWAFDMTPEGVTRTGTPRAGERRQARTPPRAGQIAVVGAVSVLALAGGAWWVSGGESPHVALDEGAIAVLPFRTSGAESELQYLREGMLDLLAAKLTGEGGPRATDPRSTMSLWRRTVGSEAEDLPREAAVALARQLGAGQLLLGGVVGTKERVTLSAEVVSVSDRRLRGRATVEGRSDSVPALVDRLAAQILVRQAGQTEDRMATLADIPLPALRSYLAGEAAVRRGRWREGADHLEEALQVDSTFGLAALALHSALGFTGDARRSPSRARALRLAWAAREGLSERDRLRLTAVAGPAYPGPSAPPAEIEAREAAVAAAPDNPELWYLLGDSYYHSGPSSGYTDWEVRSRSAMTRAFQLDSAYAAPMLHLVELAVLAEDTAELRRLTDVHLARDTVGETAALLGWYRTAVLGDSPARTAFRDRFEDLPSPLLAGIITMSTTLGVGLASGDADAAADILYRRAGSAAEKAYALRLRASIEFTRGRSGEAFEAVGEIARLRGDPGLRALDQVVAGYFGLAHADTAAAAAEELARALVTDPARYPMRGVWAAAWKLVAEEDTAASRDMLRRIRAAAADDSVPPPYLGAVHVTELGIDALKGGPGAEADLARLDSIGRSGDPRTYFGANILAAWLHERAGDPGAALEAVRRNLGVEAGMRAALLRDEGRLAALTGDTVGAIRAYRRYLALRHDPEPLMRPEVNAVRAELARLAGERVAR